MSLFRTALAALLGLAPLSAQADPKPPQRLPAPPEPEKKLDFDAHVAELRKKMPRGFHLVVEPPFVVIGDESKAAVARRAKSTVKWTVDLLKKAYFERDPDHIIDIWLFKDAESYRQGKHVRWNGVWA